MKKNASNIFGFVKLLPRRNKIGLAFFGFICAILLNTGAKAQVIITRAVTPTAWCEETGGAVSVPFFLFNYFYTKNGQRTFIAELSDPEGFFHVGGVLLGSLTVNTSQVYFGAIEGTMPPGLLPGSHYRIRVEEGRNYARPNINGNLKIVSIPSRPGLISGASDVCANTSGLVYSVANDTNVTSYAWTLPLGWTGTSTTNSITVTPGVSGGTLSVIASNPCGSSTDQSKTVTVTSIPPQPGSISGASVVCTGSLQVYSVANDTTASSYTWTLPPGWSGSSTTNSITATAGVSGGTIGVTANNFCGSGTPQTTAVSIGPPAKPGTPSGQQTDLCSGGQTTITVPPDPDVTYTWTIPATSTHLHFVSTSTTNSVALNVDPGMSHETVEATAANACGASEVKVINLWGHPTRPMVLGPTCVAANLQDVIFSVTNAEAGATYTWTPSGAIEYVSGQGTPVYTVNWKHSDGNVTVYATNDCGSTGITRWLVTICGAPFAGNGTAVSSTPVHVYPNPASSSAQISFTANKETKYAIELTDKTGRLLQRRELIANAGENKVTLDLGKYANGIYFVNVVGEDRRQAAQIIKTN